MNLMNLHVSNQSSKVGGKHRCPCTKCKNRVYLTPDEVMIHLMYKGFVKGYWYWISHEEVESGQYDFGYSTNEMAETSGSSHTNHNYNEHYVDRMKYMIGDVILSNQNTRDEGSNTWEEPFYNRFKLLNNPYMMAVQHTVNYGRNKRIKFHCHMQGCITCH